MSRLKVEKFNKFLNQKGVSLYLEILLFLIYIKNNSIKNDPFIVCYIFV